MLVGENAYKVRGGFWDWLYKLVLKNHLAVFGVDLDGFPICLVQMITRIGVASIPFGGC